MGKNKPFILDVQPGNPMAAAMTRMLKEKEEALGQYNNSLSVWDHSLPFLRDSTSTDASQVQLPAIFTGKNPTDVSYYQYRLPFQPVKHLPFDKDWRQWNEKDFEEIKKLSNKRNFLGVRTSSDTPVLDRWKDWSGGLAELDDEDRALWEKQNADKIAGMDDAYKERLYKNQQFVNIFGVDVFRSIPDAEARDRYYADYLTEDALHRKYGNNANYEQLLDLSPESRLELIESGYKSDSELKAEDKEDEDKGFFDYSLKERWNAITSNVADKAGEGMLYGSVGGIGGPGSVVGAGVGGATGVVYGTVKGIFMPETAKDINRAQRRVENNKVLEDILLFDYDQKKEEAQDEIDVTIGNYNQAYKEGRITDADVDRMFDEIALTGKKTYTDENGDIKEYRYQGSGYYSAFKDREEFEDFTIEDKLQYLAQTQVLAEKFGQDTAIRVLDADMQRYADEHETGKLGKFFINDVGIAALSYTADKINGLYNIGLMATDLVAERPTVLVSDNGEIISYEDPSLRTDAAGRLIYYDKDGNIHHVHKEQIDRSTLHNMGKNFDGSENEGILNPQYWTKAEQYGILDKEAQKKYEEYGVSPYKNINAPGEENSLWYEAFKMMSFGLADLSAQIIPFGMGKIGNALSTAKSVGRVGRGFGTAMSYTGNALINPKVQGTLGALGIGYAYNRGAFQETLAQNLANMDETVLNTSRNDVQKQYQKDDIYREKVDALTAQRAAAMKAEYLKQLEAGETSPFLDEEAMNNHFYSQARESVFNDMVAEDMQQRKASPEYAQLQQEAINSAGQAAYTTFLPEALKYGFVNNFGYRKFLYTNPTGLIKRVSPSLKGIQEVTTEGGLQRLTTDATKYLTRKDKLKLFGKAIGKQMWGGSWTNGSDDMMVDAAEQINADSFSKYLHAYETGEPIADTYGLSEGLYSYWKGLNNSLEQGTTWRAAAVGGLGSVVSATPNFVNMAHLVTKEGREAFKERYQQRKLYDVDTNGFRKPKTDAEGNAVTEKVGWRENWRDRLSYFIQNGVLSEYYGAKASEQDLQNQADYINNILDNYNDFRTIEDLITSNVASQNAANAGDAKTMQFVNAIHSINALNHLDEGGQDASAMSSVVQNAKSLIQKAAEMKFDGSEDSFSEAEVNDLLTQYYAANSGIPRSEANDQKALYQISENAQKLQEAAKAYDKAEEQVQSVEKSIGRAIDPAVRDKMKLDQALNGHWEDRLQQMRDEIDDTSTMEEEVSDDMILSTVGGKKNAEALVKVYDKQLKELEDELKAQEKETEKERVHLINVANDAHNKYGDKAARVKEVTETQARHEASLQQEQYLKDLIVKTQVQQDRVKYALKHPVLDAEGKETEKVLTADEIFRLNPVARAKMMRPENRSFYSQEQQREINKLEQQLLMKDGDALQKVQDIALLSQRIAMNQDAYSRMAKNPEAAAAQFEIDRAKSANTAYKLMNQRNAETVAEMISQFDRGNKHHRDVTQESREGYVYRVLRKLNSSLLDIIDEDKMLPQYQKQVADAKEWGQITSDIDAVIKEADHTDDWKEIVGNNISRIINQATSKADVMATLEKVIDDTDNTQAAADVETVLQGLEKLGYQRDATVIEKREKRRARQAQEKAAKEAAAKKSQEDAQTEAAKKAAEEQEKKWVEESKQKNPVNADGSNLQSPWDVAPIDQSEETSEQKGELSEPIDITEENVGNKKAVLQRPSYHKSMKEQLSDRKSKWDYYTEDDKNSTQTPEGRKIDGNTWQFTITSAINYAVDAGLLGKEHKILVGEKTSVEGSNKARKAIAELKKLGINSPSELISFVEQHEGKRGEDLYTSQQKTESSVNDDMGSNLIDNGETVQGKSSTIDEQVAVEGQKEQHTSDEVTDVATVNGTGEHVIENSATTLSGNAMSEYQSEPLQNEGKLEHKKGESTNDSMSKFYAWMNAAGIKLQNIIDTELAEILRRNPQAKVKFLAVRPQSNATNDGDMKRHLMLVLDYDNSINKGITNIHSDENGGVLESNSKKYLVIGVAGYGNRNADKLALYDILFSNNPNSQNGYGLVRRGMGEFFRSNPNERFYVPEGLNTEVVADSLIPGYIVKQLEGEENAQYRSVTELLKDEQRNPLGLDMQSLAWGIQEKTKFLVVGTSLDRVMVPRNVEGNLGSAFVLVPAANGKMVPSYLKPLFYNEMNDGKLKDRINDLLMDVVSPNYATRLAAVNELSKIFYFGKDGYNILLGKDGSRHSNEVSLKRGEDTLKTFVLNSEFDRQQFMEAIADMNPRINITASVLQSPVMLQQYDEAGALQTDIARLATAGSSYSIYGVDAQGNMIKPDVVNNDIPRDAANTEFRNGDKTQVIYNHNFYQYDTTTDQYLLNGEVVRDANVLKQLDYNRRIIESGLAPVQTEGIWKYYILGSEEHPEVVKVNKNTYEVQEVKNKQAQDLIDKVAKEKDDRERDEAAKQEIEKLDKMQREAIEKGEVILSESLVVDPETGELVTESLLKEKEKKEEEVPVEQQNSNQESTVNKSEARPQIGTQGNTQTLNDLVKSKAYRVRVITTVRNKWPQAPTKITELEKFLRDKNVEVDAIGTSEVDVQAWIKTLEDCR